MHCRLFHNLVFVCILILSLASCKDTNRELEDIRRQLAAHEQEIQALKAAVERINQDISSLQSVLHEMRAGSYVSSVMESISEGTVTGYTLSFSDGHGIFLRTEARQDSPAPAVSIRKYEDGAYYWTLNGEWLKNTEGKKIPASAEQGVTPLLRAEDGRWSVSIDHGNTWSEAAASATGISFQHVDTSHPDYVLITLSDGTVLQLPTWSAFVTLRNKVNQLNTNLSSLQTIVAALQNNDYLLSVSPFTENGEQAGWLFSFSKSGVVLVYSGTTGLDGATPRLKIEEGYWWISYDNGETWTRMDKAVGEDGDSFISDIDFSDTTFVTLILSDGTTLSIPRFRPSDLILALPTENNPIQAGETLPVRFSVSGSDPGKSVVTAASDGHFLTRVERTSDTEGTLFVTAPNPYVDGYVILMLDDGNGYSTMRVIHFCQRSLTLSEGILFQIDENGGTITIPWTGNYSFSASTDAPWIHPVRTRTDMNGEIVLSVDPNPTGESRTGIVRIHPDDNPGFTAMELAVREATATVHPSESQAMSLTVRPSFANGFTIVLPFRGNVHCTVNWGDGNVDSYDGDLDDTWVQHTYSASEPTDFVVSVSGTAERMNTADIPQKAGIISVEHWGNLGVQSVDHAFSQLSSLRSVCADTEGFFSLVTDCTGIFEGCVGLTELPGGLFRSGADIRTFEFAFNGCSGLSSLPAELLAGCGNATDFSCMFQGCSNLETVPADLFAPCPRARRFFQTFCLSGLTEVPEGLFASSPDIEDFEAAFRECSALTTLPAGLFDYNRKVQIFAFAFWGCWNLRGESPYSLVDGQKVHLYERIGYPDWFVAPIRHEGCFNMEGLEDIEAIRAAGWFY